MIANQTILWETSIIRYHSISFPCCIAVPPWQDRPAALEHSNMFMTRWFKTWSEIFWWSWAVVFLKYMNCKMAMKLWGMWRPIFAVRDGTTQQSSQHTRLLGWGHYFIYESAHQVIVRRGLIQISILDPCNFFPAVMLQQFASWRLSKKSKLNRLISSRTLSRKLTVENETTTADNK